MVDEIHKSVYNRNDRTYTNIVKGTYKQHMIYGSRCVADNHDTSNNNLFVCDLFERGIP